MFSRLRIYTVHVNPSLPHAYEAAEFVQEGFNFRAFVFVGFWALYYRLWIPAILLFGFSFSMLYLLSSETFSHTGVAILDFGGRLIIGFHANDWLRKRLKKRGYLTADITAGDSELRAEQRFYDRYFATHKASA